MSNIKYLLLCIFNAIVIGVLLTYISFIVPNIISFYIGACLIFLYALIGYIEYAIINRKKGSEK